MAQRLEKYSSPVEKFFIQGQKDYLCASDNYLKR